MTERNAIRDLLLGGAAALLMVWGVSSLPAQDPDPKKAPAVPKAPPKKNLPAAKKNPDGKNAQTGNAQRKAPMTAPEVKGYWQKADDQLATNELQRGLAFEPEEDWLNALVVETKVQPSQVPLFSTALRKLIAPAPDVQRVADEVPALLNKLRDAVQNRDELAVEALLHPDLRGDKGKVYPLFDKTNYRNHSLGRYSPQPFRRVGVPFYQLTSSQVELLHYLQFSLSNGKIVLRDVASRDKDGKDVAVTFLKDEVDVARSKLNLMFRALNDGDDIGLKNLCTPGMYDSLRRLAGNVKAVGNFLMKGQLRTVETSSVSASVPVDAKSIRVVFRLGYVSKLNRKIEFDVDFERIDNDLKVVRLRDVENKVIAFDPNIDNYLNRRYGLPDSPPLGVDDVAWSEIFPPVSELSRYVQMAIDNRNAVRLKEYAAEYQESVPTGGEWKALRASSHFMSGNYDEAEKDALPAIDAGGTVYFYVLRHFASALGGDQLVPVVLGVSKQGIEYRPPAGKSAAAREQIPIGSIEKIEFDKPSGPLRKFGSVIGQQGGRPFLKLEFRAATAKREKKEYNFAAAGTTVTAGQAGNPLAGAAMTLQPPANWDRIMVVVQKTVQQAALAQPKR